MEPNLQMKSDFMLGNSITLEQLEGDVHAIHHKLREVEPVSWVPAIDCWLVTDRQLCVAVMRDARTYTVDHPGFSTGQVVGPSMLSLDGKTHLKHRKPFEQPFRRREVEQRFRQPVGRFINELIAGFKPKGAAELRRDFAGPIAVKTMVEALGMDETPVKQVLGWYDTIVDAVTRVSAGEPVSDEGKAAFGLLKESLLPVLKRDAETSLLASAAGLADGLSDDQIISNAAVLLFGGIETTEGMIANALYHLFNHPQVLAQVRDDLDLISAAIEESLRMEPAASVVDRYTTAETELAGVTIPEGDLVRVSLAGANRDPNTFPDPDRFDPGRKNLRSHVTWAQGPHVCLGLHLARLEAQESIKQLLVKLPNLKIKIGNESTPKGLIFRKPEALQASW
ncbi:MAG: cytochrome P450 [Chloroflexota bacterium]